MIALSIDNTQIWVYTMSITKDDKQMTNISKMYSQTTEAGYLLNLLAERDTEKRPSQDTSTTDTLPDADNLGIIAWLRSLAPLSDNDIYNQAWKD
jgi:hypothetical protein